jgi:hypothetical protein
MHDEGVVFAGASLCHQLNLKYRSAERSRAKERDLCHFLTIFATLHLCGTI